MLVNENDTSRTARSRAVQVLCHAQLIPIHTCQRLQYAPERNVTEYDCQKLGVCAPGQTRSCYTTSATRERHTCIKRRHPSIIASFNGCPNFVVKGNQTWLQWNRLPEGWCWPWAHCASGEERKPTGRQLCGQRPPQWGVATALVPMQWLLPMAEHVSFPTSHSPPLSGCHLQWFLTILTKLVVLNGAKPAGDWDHSSKTGPVRKARGGDVFASCPS